MTAQLPLFDAPPACTAPLEDLAREVTQSRRVPLWAALAGEGWFARAWDACTNWRTLMRLAWLAWGWSPTAEWLMVSIHVDCVAGGDAGFVCRECVDRVRADVGAVSLAMLRAGLERRHP
jgi:hypothetical protein